MTDDLSPIRQRAILDRALRELQVDPGRRRLDRAGLVFHFAAAFLMVLWTSQVFLS